MNRREYKVDKFSRESTMFPQSKGISNIIWLIKTNWPMNVYELVNSNRISEEHRKNIWLNVNKNFWNSHT